MAIPDFQSILLPLLKLTASRKELTTKDAYHAMSAQFEVTAAEVAEPMASGRGSKFKNRVAWAKQYLVYATLVEPVRHGVSRATDLGKRWAKERTAPLRIRDFAEIPGFDARVHGSGPEEGAPSRSGSAGPEIRADPLATTPAERMATAHAELRQSVITTLLDRIRERPPEFFERLVIELMSKLNYGDGTAESMLHTGKTADGGIDGRIKMDVLGLEHIFLQAKRYDAKNTISREQVAAFAGSIAGAKGVFLTTSTFSPQAIDFVRKHHDRIVLVDGQQLGELMLRSGLGVSRRHSYDLHAIDEDFFADDE